MNYKIEEKNNQIILKDIKDFEPEHIFECGQAFRWEKLEDDSYNTIAFNRVLNVKKVGKDVVLTGTDRNDFDSIWYDYFDLGTDYGGIKKVLGKDEILKEAMEYGYGIRILNQEPFETIISFIISANNQIPRIKRSIKLISENYGDFITKIGEENYYGFPSADVLAKVDVKELREISRIGFRDERVIKTSQIISNNPVGLNNIFRMTKEEGKSELMKLPGVGPKVADCVLLFAFKKGNSFPVDTWIKRVMEYFYLKEETPVSKIGKIGDEMFGDLAGYAQQYLFYYAREEAIGK